MSAGLLGASPFARASGPIPNRATNKLTRTRDPLQPTARSPPSARRPFLSPTTAQRPLLLAALGACAGLLALSAAFPRPTARDEDAEDERQRQEQQQLAAALDREARGVTSGVLWGTREQEQKAEETANDKKRKASEQPQ